MRVNHIYQGDALKTLKTFPDNSIDTIITDAPYGLKFMGKKWDYDVPNVELWRECLRVLKPGGTALVFAGTRTQHRMAINIEDAGFVLKDCIMWIYGSGFPKSHNIGKAVDKMQGNIREVIGTIKAPGYAKKEVEMGKQNRNTYNFSTTKGNSPWEGWGTALKPAYEPILVAMKPVEGTYAANALKWGVAGLNIDKSRIEYVNDYDKKHQEDIAKGQDNATNGKFFGGIGKSKASTNKPQGRFPANVILDEEAGEALDRQSGYTKSTIDKKNHSGKGTSLFVKNKVTKIPRNDEGGASRFFYMAKASKSERNAGLEDWKERQTTDGNIRSNPETARTYQANSAPRKNFHPTVKPLKLMQYLCALTATPTGGIVLDPFIGSGTTALACQRTGRQYVGIELEKEYVEIAQRRLSQATLGI